MFSSERPSDVGTVGLLAATGLMVLGLLAVWIPIDVTALPPLDVRQPSQDRNSHV